MQNDNNYMNRELDSQIRKIGLDEPSPVFTDKIMQSIVASHVPVQSKNRLSLYWLFLSIPVIGVLGLIISLRYDVNTFFFNVWSSSLSYLEHGKSSITLVVDKLSGFSLSPLVIAGILAIAALLLIDELLARRNLLHRKI